MLLSLVFLSSLATRVLVQILLLIALLIPLLKLIAMLKLLIATVLMLKLQLKLLPKTHLKLRHNLSDKQKSLKLFSTRWKAAFFFYTPLPPPFAQQMQ